MNLADQTTGVVSQVLTLVVMVYFGSLAVALLITWYRFIVAWNRRYRALTGWPLLVYSIFGVPWRSPFRPGDLYREWDDPEVDRLRRHAKSVWRVWFVSILIPGVVVGLFVLFVLVYSTR